MAWPGFSLKCLAVGSSLMTMSKPTTGLLESKVASFLAGWRGFGKASAISGMSGTLMRQQNRVAQHVSVNRHGEMIDTVAQAWKGRGQDLQRSFRGVGKCQIYRPRERRAYLWEQLRILCIIYHLDRRIWSPYRNWIRDTHLLEYRLFEKVAFLKNECNRAIWISLLKNISVLSLKHKPK